MDDLSHYMSKTSAYRKALKYISSNMHQVGLRPCRICKDISEILDEPFGCTKHQLEHDSELKAKRDKLEETRQKQHRERIEAAKTHYLQPNRPITFINGEKF